MPSAYDPGTMARSDKTPDKAPDQATLLQRIDPLFAWVPVAIYAIWVFSKGHEPNQDAYYHVGCAGLYATRGWLSEFPWLPLTVLGESFPNVHLGMHLLLAPLTWFLEPLVALKVATVLMSGGVVISIYLVLRRWEVPHPGVWAMLGPLLSPLFVSWGSSLKGGSLFFILFIWFIDALWDNAPRRVFILAWISVYAYVGAPILIAVLLVYLVIGRIWDGAWPGRIAAAGLGGLAGGYILNPFWPGQWVHTARELSGGLAGYFGSAGRFIGYEWISPPGDLVLRFAFLYLAIWMVLLVRGLDGSRRVPTLAVTGTVIALGLLGASLLGVKHFQLFFIASCLFIPLHYSRTRPWPTAVTLSLLVAAILTAGWATRTSWQDLHSAGRVPAEDYRVMAEQLELLTQPDQMVIVPWDDFPGLFLFSKHNRYPVGMNVAFLRWASEERFQAYTALYQGRVEDPAAIAAEHFEDAQLILLRPSLHPRLLRLLSNHPGSTEVPSRAGSWRMFRVSQTQRR
ncbi:hypothetical protein ABI59_10640 [Acidobacteria bacterium Mor1]|nr:hypothetical protein ABI59_10640 [Acidobacteria bacterium Mor1]